MRQHLATASIHINTMRLAESSSCSLIISQAEGYAHLETGLTYEHYI
jgi:hypothetical protein